MKPEAFEKKIEQELKTLNREQVVQFALRCALRALPFLGSGGNFNFWKEESKQKNIYAIFHAIDIVSSHSLTFTAIPAAIVSAAADASASAADSCEVSASASISASASASAATDAVSYATDAAYADADAASSYFSSSASSSYASSSYASSSSIFLTVAANSFIDLRSIIINDIIAIRNKEVDNQKIDLDLYGKVWGNFQDALAAEGCAYWGKLYQDIFDNDFVLDQEALQQRINVPKEIQVQGAAIVANYLEELEEGATQLNEARIIILGDKGSGKTCMARRLINPNALMTTGKESTPGVETSLWKLEKENINVTIWDFAGHTVTHAVHQFFLSERDRKSVV